MKKLNVAILEDNKELLNDLKRSLEKTELVEVMIWASGSEEFLSKMNQNQKAGNSPEAMILDIDLLGDSMNGIDIANKIKLPVLFVSGKVRDFYNDIETLNLSSQDSIEFITKPITVEKLNKMLPKFISEIESKKKTEYVYLHIGENKKEKIDLDTIVCICADKNDGSKSLNKQIFFTDRKKEILNDFSFQDLEDKGLTKPKFIFTHKSFKVNANKIISYNKLDHTISVKVYGEKEPKTLSVSDSYLKDILKLFP
jgi:DNA-binding LytR/AlgR family response regulator